jgi:hypothetical protein
LGLKISTTHWNILDGRFAGFRRDVDDLKLGPCLCHQTYLETFKVGRAASLPVCLWHHDLLSNRRNQPNLRLLSLSLPSPQTKYTQFPTSRQHIRRQLIFTLCGLHWTATRIYCSPLRWPSKGTIGFVLLTSNSHIGLLPLVKLIVPFRSFFSNRKCSNFSNLQASLKSGLTLAGEDLQQPRTPPCFLRRKIPCLLQIDSITLEEVCPSNKVEIADFCNLTKSCSTRLPSLDSHLRTNLHCLITCCRKHHL